MSQQPTTPAAKAHPKLKPPTQEELRKLCLRQGTNVDLVLERNDQRETMETRPSLVYDHRGKLLILAQVSPALGKANLGEIMEITFLTRRFAGGDEPESIRAGYVTPLQEVVQKFPLAEGLVEPALIFLAPQQLKLMNLRMHHRMVPPLEFVMRATVTVRGTARVPQKIPAIIADISLGGALLLHDPHWEPEHNSEFSLELFWDRGNLELQARVIRLSQKTVSRGEVKGSTAIRFKFEETAQRTTMFQLIGRMERWEIAQRDAWEKE